MPRILVVDDDRELLSNVLELLGEEGFEVVSATNGRDAVALARARAPDLVVCDIGMPGMDGYQVLRALREQPATAHMPFIFLTARAERVDVRTGMNLGADDYVTKPFQLTELLEAVRARLRRLGERAALAHAALATEAPPSEREEGWRTPPGVVLLDPVMRGIYAQLEQVAQSQLNVLILGETGVGKEVLARSVHELSMRRSAPFLPINCAALSEHLLEAELFGHEKGAFTGAHHARAGLFEAAHGGTVFLDEVGELPLSMQTKLLRVLEDRKIMRVGGRSLKEVDVRFVAATNRNLKHEIGQRAFREDLYYRLNGMSFTLPPLRERRSEIAPLCQVFATRACIEHGKPAPMSLSPRALELLARHDWPGNVRELKNVIERAVVLSRGRELDVEDLPSELCSFGTESSGTDASSKDASSAPAPREAGPPASEGDPTLRLHRELAELERQRVLNALAESGGNQTLAAERLGVSRRTLVYRLSAFGLTRSRKRGSAAP